MRYDTLMRVEEYAKNIVGAVIWLLMSGIGRRLEDIPIHGLSNPSHFSSLYFSFYYCVHRGLIHVFE